MVNITTEERDSRAYVRANGHFTQVPVHDVVIEPVKGKYQQSIREPVNIIVTSRETFKGTKYLKIIGKMCSDTTRAITNTNLVIDARYCPALSSPT